MFLIPLLCIISSAYAMQVANQFDQAIMDMLKLKPSQLNNKKLGKFSLFGQGCEMRPWDLQNLELNKPVLARPFTNAVNPSILQNAYPAAQFDPIQTNKVAQPQLAPFSDQKEFQQFSMPNMGSFQNQQMKMQNQEALPFADAESIAMQSFPMDMNMAALRAMQHNNPTMFDMKNIMREQGNEGQRKMQQREQLPLRIFGNEQQNSEQMKMMKKPGLFEGISMNPEAFNMKKQFISNRPNQRENNGFPEAFDFSGFQGRQ